MSCPPAGRCLQTKPATDGHPGPGGGMICFLLRLRTLLLGLVAGALAPDPATAQGPSAIVPRVGILTPAENDQTPLPCPST
jgi:hypothetical protein